MTFEEYLLFESSHDSLMSIMYNMSGVIIKNMSFVSLRIRFDRTKLILVTNLDVQCPWSTVVTNNEI